MPDRDVFYVAGPFGSIETRSLPSLARRYPRDFTFYVAYPSRSIRPKANGTPKEFAGGPLNRKATRKLPYGARECIVRAW